MSKNESSAALVIVRHATSQQLHTLQTAPYITSVPFSASVWRHSVLREDDPQYEEYGTPGEQLREKPVLWVLSVKVKRAKVCIVHVILIICVPASHVGLREPRPTEGCRKETEWKSSDTEGQSEPFTES